MVQARLPPPTRSAERFLPLPRSEINLCNPEEIVAQRWIGRRLEAAINDLPLEFREPMLLVDVHELSYPEVATVLNIPLGTVKSRVSRARALLRASLRAAVYAPGKTGT